MTSIFRRRSSSLALNNLCRVDNFLTSIQKLSPPYSAGVSSAPRHLTQAVGLGVQQWGVGTETSLLIK